MKIILIANLSANGKVLLAENPLHAAPQQALGFFLQQANLKGNIIIGRKTFDVLQQFPGGLRAIFPEVEIVLLSRSLSELDGYKVVDSAEDALRYLQSKGFKEIIIGGGSEIYNVFLEKELVTEIYFNYIPIVIGDGGIIGRSEDLNSKFQISHCNLIEGGIAQLHLTKT